MTGAKMESLLRRVYSSRRLSQPLKLLSHAVSVVAAIAFLLLGAYLFMKSPISLVKLLLICGVPFLLVSALRVLINAKRPYELYDFYETPPKNKPARSFPSRHAYSAFSIGTAVCFVSPLLGAVLLLLSTAMCLSRVLLGIHFIRDVACGALIGALSSVLGFIILSPV